ncbi:MAG TPA: sulfurtransferase TusA family protein [Methylomirabilota bacterium]|nr:sulfurtransferase TusA family protein [Methylomirabilota bacterium]
MDEQSGGYAEEWDAGEMGCGELLIELSMKMKRLAPGQLFRLVALDPGAAEDMPAWCRLTGHALIRAAHPEYVMRRRES